MSLIVPARREYRVVTETDVPMLTRDGVTLYADIVRWADTLKLRGSKVFVAFHHEPEAIGSTKFGTGRRMTQGFDQNRANLLIAVLEKRGGRSGHYRRTAK